jgi:hypothetical protein
LGVTGPVVIADIVGDPEIPKIRILCIDTVVYTADDGVGETSTRVTYMVLLVPSPIILTADTLIK